jgi:hypothetical protein
VTLVADGYGEYTRLVLAAQADTDPGHRQQAMTELARLAEQGGPQDGQAAAVLARLYPQLRPNAPASDFAGIAERKGGPSTATVHLSSPLDDRIAEILAEFRQQTAALIRDITGRDQCQPNPDAH